MVENVKYIEYLLSQKKITRMLLLLIMVEVELITRKYSFFIQDMKGLSLNGKLYGNKTYLFNEVS